MKTYKIVVSDSAFTSKMKEQRIKFADKIMSILSFSSEDAMKSIVLNARETLSDMPKKRVDKLLDDMYVSFWNAMKASESIKKFINESHANDNDYVFDHSSEIGDIKTEIEDVADTAADLEMAVDKLSGEYSKFIVAPEKFVELLKKVSADQDRIASGIKTIASMMEEAFI